MPQEYLKCVESEIKSGKDKAEAQKICAIAFYKRHGITPQEAEKKGMFDMNTFSEHKFTKNDDGTFNILEVPVFEVGTHKKFNYDENWIREALNNFYDLRKKKFLPRVIIGHTTTDGNEKPAVGFLDNLKLIGKEIYADLVNLTEKTFTEIKNRAWPGRSVEVNPSKKKFTALALLGGTEPYFQFEPITDVKFEADPEGSWIEFQESLEDKKGLILQMWDKMLDVFKSDKINDGEQNIMTAEELKKIKDELRTDLKAEFDQKFDEAYTKRFKEEFGTDPKSFKQSIEKEKTAKFDEQKADVLKKIKKTLAPAVVDGYFDPIIDAFSGIEMDTIKFAEKETGTIFDLLGKFSEELVKRVAEKTLVVDFFEHAKFSGDEGNPNLNTGKIDLTNLSEEDAEKLHKAILKFQEDHKIKSYDEAAERYYEKLEVN